MRRRSQDATEPLWRRLGSRDPAVAQAAMDELAAMTPEESAERIRRPTALNAKLLRGFFSISWALGFAVAGVLFVRWHEPAVTIWGWALGLVQAVGAGLLGLLTASFTFAGAGLALRCLTPAGRAAVRWLGQTPSTLAAAPIADLLDACRSGPLVPDPCRHHAEQALADRLAGGSEREVSTLDAQRRQRMRMLLSTQASFVTRSRFEGVDGFNGKPGDRHCVPLILAILRAYETITDAEALKEVEKCVERADELERLGRSTDASRTVANACRALLPDLRARVEAQRRGETLLRPASADGDTLLRPAETDEAHLLRPAQEDQQTQQH